MSDKVPEMHVELLEQEIVDLRIDDERYVVETYSRMRMDFKPSGKSLVDRMMKELETIHQLLCRTDCDLDERQRKVCVAAIKYFLKEGDHIGDDYHQAGLVDDALVVRAATIELGPILK